MKAVYFDVDTQLDFLFPAGALYAPGAEGIVPAVARLNRHAAEHGIALISTVDAHSEGDPEFQRWPPHCVAGTLGQRKPERTLLAERVTIPSAPSAYSIRDARQILLEKQALDCFTNPNLPGLLERLGAERYVVYGVVTEFCVRCAAMGLLRAATRVEVVSDAIQGLNLDQERRSLDEFTQAGGRLITLAEALSG